MFKTDDILLAAVLKLNGHSLKTIEKQEGRGTFIFDDVDAKLVQDYDLGQALVEPTSFNSAIRSLKTATKR